MVTLDVKFEELKGSHFSCQQVAKGLLVISRIQGPVFYIKILWELITTVVVYSPSVNNYMRDVIISVRNSWMGLSENDQVNVIAVLSHWNKNGKIDQILKKY